MCDKLLELTEPFFAEEQTKEREIGGLLFSVVAQQLLNGDIHQHFIFEGVAGDEAHGIDAAHVAPDGVTGSANAVAYHLPQMFFVQCKRAVFIFPDKSGANCAIHGIIRAIGFLSGLWAL